MAIKYDKQLINELAIEWYETRDRNTREKLFAEIQPYCRYIVVITHKSRRSRITEDDLMQEAMMGVLHALEQKFDPEKGNFCDYSSWWIKQYIMRHINREFSVVTIKRNDNNTIIFPKYRKLYNMLQSHDPMMTRDEIHAEMSAILGVKVKYIDEHANHLSGCNYISETKRNRHGQSYSESENNCIDHTIETPENMVDRMRNIMMVRKVAKRVADKLDRNRQTVIRDVLMGHRTQLEIGREIGVSKQRIGQIKDDCIFLIGRALRAEMI